MNKRIVIVGICCTGNSTLGSKLAHVLGCKFIDLDELHWRPNWLPTPTSKLKELVGEEIQGDSWFDQVTH